MPGKAQILGTPAITRVLNNNRISIPPATRFILLQAINHSLSQAYLNDDLKDKSLVYLY